MTALAGYWGRSTDSRPAEQCARMLRAQRHYASEAGVSWADERIALGRALYRLLPEDRFDRTPQTSSDGRFVLIADVRLDNRGDLARMMSLGGEYSRLSDTAVLMAAWERWQQQCLVHLVGDFAFALFDREAQKLHLARDFLGQRPLHFHEGDDFFAFASMPKGLHSLPDIPYAPSDQALTNFLALLPETDERSFFEKVSKVPAGHLLTRHADGRRTLERYWDPRPASPGIPPSAYAEALRHQLDEAVAARLRGAGSVGSYLSAGLDSASVTATAARLLSTDGRPLSAFTAVPRSSSRLTDSREAIVDEGPMAAMVANRFANIRHILVESSYSSPTDNFDKQFLLYERPVLNPVNFTWVDRIRDLARASGISVLLSGSAGNHTASYSGMEWLPELLASGRWMRFAATAAGLRKFGLRYGTILAQSVGPFLPASAWRTIAAARGKGRDLADYSFLRIDGAVAREVERRARDRQLDLSYRARRDPVGTRIWALQRVDPGNYNKGALAGWGIDERDPTADNRLVEFCLSLPPEDFIAGGVPRSLIRAAMADRLPTEVLGERRRGIQAADWPIMLRGRFGVLREELDRIERTPGSREIIDLDKIKDLTKEAPSEAELAHKAQIYRVAMMRAFAAGHFLRKAKGSN